MTMQNYIDLAKQHGQVKAERDRLTKMIDRGPVAFYRRGEIPHATHIGWTSSTALFYTPNWIKEEWNRRFSAAVEKRNRLAAKEIRLARRLLAKWARIKNNGEKMTLAMMGYSPSSMDISPVSTLS